MSLPCEPCLAHAGSHRNAVSTYIHALQTPKDFTNKQQIIVTMPHAKVNKCAHVLMCFLL